MPSVSESSWVSEVHVPPLIPGLTDVGLLEQGWETAPGPRGHSRRA